MTSSNGTHGNRHAVFGVSAAARYRELRVNRPVYALSTLLLVAPWAMWLLNLWSDLNMPAQALAASHTTVAAVIRETLRGFAQGVFNFRVFDLFVAAGVGVALFAYDRYVGGLFYSLEGPLRRREVFGAKALFGTATILLAVAAGTAGTLLFAAVSGNLVQAGGILLRGLFLVAGELSLFATALAFGSAMGTVFSAVATVTWAALPALLQSLLSNLFRVWGTQVVTQGAGGPHVVVRMLKFASPWVAHLAMDLPNLSPFQPSGFYGWSTGAVFGLITWFIAWTLLLFWQGVGWWERAAFERLRDGVFFPSLWNLYYAFLSLASALVLTELLTHGTVYGVAWATMYLMLSSLGWFFWRFIVQRRVARLP